MSHAPGAEQRCYTLVYFHDDWKLSDYQQLSVHASIRFNGLYRQDVKTGV